MRKLRLLTRLLLITFLFSSAFTQTTVGTGSIVGTVIDQSGAVVSGAEVTITNQGTGQTTSLTTNSVGAYTSGALVPGEYKVLTAICEVSVLSPILEESCQAPYGRVF
jgi:Carboxypeptidase regulatory-like domain